MVYTKRILQEDPLGDTILSEKAAKNFMQQEISNCMMKFRQEVTKYSFNDVIHTWWLDSKYVIAEENLICQRKCFPAYNKKIKPHIEYAYMTFQKKCGAKHGAHPWQWHHFQAKEFI